MNILITGTSKGIGKALAMEYLSKGHAVYGISRNSDEQLDAHEKFHFLSQDLSDLRYTSIHLANFMKKHHVRDLDLVVLNAGILNAIKDMQDTEVAELKHIMDVNVWSNKVILDTLLRMTGKLRQVVAISSGAARSGARGWNGYSISKAALNMLIQLYAKEQSETHFCTMAPGLIDTGMQEYISQLPDDDRFPVVDKLKKARGTDQMPPPEKAAPDLVKAFENALEHDSGTDLDIREM